MVSRAAYPARANNGSFVEDEAQEPHNHFLTHQLNSKVLTILSAPPPPLDDPKKHTLISPRCAPCLYLTRSFLQNTLSFSSVQNQSRLMIFPPFLAGSSSFNSSETAFSSFSSLRTSLPPLPPPPAAALPFPCAAFLPLLLL